MTISVISGGASSEGRAGSIAPWLPLTDYSAGDLVSYASRVYEIRATGTSGATWSGAAVKPAALSAIAPVGTLDREIPVLCLHGDDPTTTVKSALRRGLTPVWVSEIIAAMRGQITLPKDPVCLTFDDGRYENWSVAHPVLLAYAFKATHFIVSKYTDGDYANVDASAGVDPALPQTQVPGAGVGGPMSWAQLRTLRDTGLYDFQNHTQTHHVATGQTAAALKAELAACNAKIMAELGVPKPEGFAIRGGSTNAGQTVAMREAGMALIFDINGGATHTDQFTRLPNGHMMVGRSTSAQLWERAYQSVFVDWTTALAGQINEGNALDFWTITAGSSLGNIVGNGIEHRATRVDASTAGSIETTDFFKVVPGDKLRFHGSTLSVGQSAGTGVLRIKQFDINKGALADIDLKTYTTTDAGGRVDVTKTLDAACEFVKLRIDVSADNPGSFRLRNPTFRRAAPG